MDSRTGCSGTSWRLSLSAEPSVCDMFCVVEISIILYMGPIIWQFILCNALDIHSNNVLYIICLLYCKMLLIMCIIDPSQGVSIN